MRDEGKTTLFKKKTNQNDLVHVSEDDVYAAGTNMPEDIKRFLNDQINQILEQKFYPEYALFEKLQTDRKFKEAFVAALPLFITLMNEYSKNYSHKMNLQSYIEKHGIPLEKFVTFLIMGTYLQKIDKSSMAWICPSCRRVIGLIDKVPADLEKKYPTISIILPSYFTMYTVVERVVCPECSSRDKYNMKPHFLLSGVSLQSQIDKGQKMLKEEKKYF
jgi:hypothetical protein